ncbi:solute carrier family 35 member F1, partial [Sigmodon hispidus]
MIPPEPPQPQLQPPPPPAPPNHVVTTIENLPAEGSGAGSLSASSRAGMRQRIRKVLN